MLTKERMKNGTGWVNRYVYTMLTGEGKEECPHWARELAIGFLSDLLTIADNPRHFTIGGLYCVGWQEDGFGGHELWAAWLDNGSTINL